MYEKNIKWAKAAYNDGFKFHYHHYDTVLKFMINTHGEDAGGEPIKTWIKILDFLHHMYTEEILIKKVSSPFNKSKINRSAFFRRQSKLYGDSSVLLFSHS